MTPDPTVAPDRPKPVSPWAVKLPWWFLLLVPALVAACVYFDLSGPAMTGLIVTVLVPALLLALHRKPATP